jgi:RND family efflux transporter MFP subunit
MSSEQAPSLEGLRIDRSKATAHRQSPWLWPVLLVLLATVAGVAWWFLKPETLEVETATARPESTTTSNGGEVQRTLLNATGYVTARRQATVSSKITGKVVEIHVEEGLKVEEGSVLAKLDDTNVVASLNLAKAQLESAKKAVEETKPNLVFARQELERFTGLVKTKAASISDLNRAQAQAEAEDAKLIRQTAEVAVAQRQVETWTQQLDDTIIRAPFSGIVTTKNAQPGEMISPMSVGGFTRTGICTLVDMKSLEIEVDVNESYINRVESGQPVVATLDSYPDWQIPCKVIAIIPTADRQKATVKVRVGFEKLDPRILPDMGVKVAFQSAEKANQPNVQAKGVIVPKTAVQHDHGKDVVWVLHEGRAERRAVTVARTVGDESTITAGLSSAEKVAVHVPPNLKDGSRVKEKKS